MSKNWIMLAGLLFLGSVGTSQGHPLDSADIEYVDGLPCNRACQSYLAWSRRLTLSATPRSAPVEPVPVEAAPEKPALRSASPAISHAKAVHRESSKPAVARIAKQAVPLRPAKIEKQQPAGDAAVNSEPAPANVAALPPEDGAATSRSRTVQEQVAAATALAEQVTAANATPVPQPQASNVEASVPAEAAGPGDIAPTVQATPNSRDNRVALLMARPEIVSVSDLSGKDVAMEDQQSASGASIRAAIVAAGAAEIQLNEVHTKAIDRLIRGEVPAAVLTLVSPEAAEWFPEIPGYKVFRIPFSPDPLKARL
jgi:hypothetical protein